MSGSSRAPQRFQVIAKGRTRAAQAKLQPADLAQAPLDARAQRPNVPALLRMDEAAAYLRYEGPRAAEAAARFLRRHGVRLIRRGRVNLVRREAIDAFLDLGESDLDRAAAKHAAR
ncbi:MAG: hypothetical protein AB7O67_23635 [Vicinamibacterales bacterium]